MLQGSLIANERQDLDPSLYDHKELHQDYDDDTDITKDLTGTSQGEAELSDSASKLGSGLMIMYVMRYSG